MLCRHWQSCPVSTGDAGVRQCFLKIVNAKQWAGAHLCIAEASETDHRSSSPVAWLSVATHSVQDGLLVQLLRRHCGEQIQFLNYITEMMRKGNSMSMLTNKTILFNTLFSKRFFLMNQLYIQYLLVSSFHINTNAFPVVHIASNTYSRFLSLLHTVLYTTHEYGVKNSW